MKEDISGELQRLSETYQSEVSQLQTKVYEQHLVPFCKKYKLDFYSGMGTCFFSRTEPLPNGRHNNLSEDDFESAYPRSSKDSKRYKDWTAMWAILNLDPLVEPGHENTLGHSLPDYRYKG